MPGACGGSAVEQFAHAFVGLVRMNAQVELGEVQAEDLDATPKRRECAVGDSCAAMGPEAAVEQLQICGEILYRRIRIRVEAPPHE